MDTKQNKYKIPFKLKKFVQVLLSEEVMGNKKEAERVSGVGRDRFYAHFNKHQEFRDYYSDQCDTLINKNEHIPALALLKKCAKGNVLAIRTFYELRRKLKIGNSVDVKTDISVMPNIEIIFSSEKVGDNGIERSFENESLLTREGSDSNRITEQI